MSGGARPSGIVDVRPTFGELKRKLLEHGCLSEIRPIFPGSDNEAGPMIERITNPKTGKWILVDEWDENEEVSPSIAEHVCRRLGIQGYLLNFDCGDGEGLVSVTTPKAKPSNQSS